MSEKNLPIKFFQKRQKDNQGTEAGGTSDLPSWVDKSLVLEKATYIQQVLSEISISLVEKATENNHLPSVIRLKITPEALTKTCRKDIASLFNVSGKLNIISVSGDDEILVKLDDQRDLMSVSKKLEDAKSPYAGNGLVTGVSAIIDAAEYEPVIDVDVSTHPILKVKLFSYGNADLDAILIKEFEKYCRKNDLDFKRTSYSNDLNIYRINSITSDGLEELSDFDGLQAVSLMPTYGVTIDEVTEEHTLPIKTPKPGVVYPIVGILDTGIADNAYLSPWILPEKHTSYVDEDIDKRHGTFVAGIINYGDELEGTAYTGFDGCKLYEAIVMPDTKKQGITEDELIHQIREAIASNDNVKVWNLSLGTKDEADLHDFSDFAHALDEIQEQHNILICKSAGNCENFKYNAPRKRISKSADTIRGLVVGSLTHAKNDTDLAEKNHASPFSRIGPGPAYMIKPDVVHMGGNVGLGVRNEVINNPVKSFAPNGGLAKQVGTSFSTPRISAIAAGLQAMLNEHFDPILIKSLIIHSAKYPVEMKMNIAEKLNNVGFGMPKGISDILFNDPNEITLIMQDTLEKGSFIEIQDFPFPQSMVDEDGYFLGEITVTLVTAPILEKSQGAEYCQSNIDVMLGTYDSKVERDTSQRGVKNPIKADGKQNVLATSIYSKASAKNNNVPFATERMMLSYGSKFQPIKKWCVSLDEFTETNKEKYLKAPKQWYLKLEGLFRHFTESKAELNKAIPSQDFCLIVTIRDTRKRGNIYNEVTRLLDNFSFVHNNIKINEEVRVRLNS